ncbi:MAG: hypothetical protein IPJ84_08705 [Bdellovibrionales bacterium]|nr:hypothetical protein [Bdellovibrionales bacterium]
MTQRAWMLFLGVFVFSGCASPLAVRELKARNFKLERELKATRSRLETARERQSALRTKVRLLEAQNSREVEAPSLAAFDEGGVREAAPLARRATVSQRPAGGERVLPALDAVDQVLYRSVLISLKSGAREQAFRDLMILEKSYPDSNRVADGYFQLALFDYRASRLLEAEQGFAKVLKLESRPRLRAGALLMTALFMKARNPEAARRQFQSIVTQYPKSVEAKRASRELTTPLKRKTL